MPDNEKVKSDIDLSKPSADRASYRRSIVKKLMLSSGITNRAEIKRILDSEYGLVVSRQRIYKDIAEISALSQGDIEEFQLDITSIYKKLIRDQMAEIEGCRDVKERSVLRGVLSRLMKDQQMVLKNMYLSGAGGVAVKEVEEAKPKEILSISFGSGKVVDKD